KRHKVIETTEIMLLMVASGRGVAALPRWLVDEDSGKIPIEPVRLGRHGIAKQIFLGLRETDAGIDYVNAFIELARRSARTFQAASSNRRAGKSSTTGTAAKNTRA